MHSPPPDPFIRKVGLGRLSTSSSVAAAALPLSSLSSSNSPPSPSPDVDRQRAHPGRGHVEELSHAARAQQRHAPSAAHQLARDAGDHKGVRGPHGERRDEVSLPRRGRGG